MRGPTSDEDDNSGNVDKPEKSCTNTSDNSDSESFTDSENTENEDESVFSCVYK